MVQDVIHHLEGTVSEVIETPALYVDTIFRHEVPDLKEVLGAYFGQC